MSALVRHFGDEEDAAQSCGVCDICDPAGAILRLFRRATPAERALIQSMTDELRSVDYKAAGTLQKSVDPSGRMTRDDFDAVLGAMSRARLIAIEDAEYEKDGEVRRYRKVSLTETGLATRSLAQVELLLSDGIAEEFAASSSQKRLRKTTKRDATGPGSEANRPSSRAARSANGEAVPANLVGRRDGVDSAAQRVARQRSQTPPRSRLLRHARPHPHRRSLRLPNQSPPTPRRSMVSALLRWKNLAPRSSRSAGPN